MLSSFAVLTLVSGSAIAGIVGVVAVSWVLATVGIAGIS